MYQHCVDGQTAPDMDPGDVTQSGVYLRNLKKNHVSKRYEDDDDGHPAYGFKLSNKHWKDASRQAGDLSVNLESCIHTAECSIVVQVDTDRYFHVARIDLDALNRARQLSSSFVAIYKPEDSPKNLCHFEVAPLDGTVSKWQELQALFDRPFPECKMPRSEGDKATAAAEYREYRSFLDIRRWVRHEDDTLG